MKVALDAGHGAQSGRPHTGAAANGLVEDELALDLVRRTGHHLRAAGCETVYTRPEDKLISLAERGRIAVTGKCDLFLSIHCNAGPASACGVEAFVAQGDHASRRIAELLAGAVSKIGLANRGVKWDSQSQHPRLAVLRETYRAMPAVLMEIGFLTSEHDSALLRDAHFRERVAVAVAGGLGNRRRS